MPRSISAFLIGRIGLVSMLRRTPFKPAIAKETKPPKGPKLTRCKVCRSPYLKDPKQPWVEWCNVDCGTVLAQLKLAKQKAKQQRKERAETKAKLDGMKTYPQIIKEVQRAFNEAVRWRDRIAGHPCISSGRQLDWSGNAVDTGHYRSVGSAPHARFNFDNCHAQSKHDNQYKSGNAVDYRIGLIARIGLDRVEALESDNTPRKWSRDELQAMKEDFMRMVRELKKLKE